MKGTRTTRTENEIVDTFLQRLGTSSARHPWRVVAGWLAALIATFAVAVAAGGHPVDDYELAGSPSQDGYNLLEEHFPELSGASAQVIVKTPGEAIQPESLTRLERELGEVPHVGTVSPARLSPDGDAALIDVSYDVPSTHEDVFGNVEPLEQAVERAGLADAEVAYGGEVPGTVMTIGGRGEVIGIVAALLLLVVAFGSLVAAGLPLLVAIFGLGLGSAIGILLSAVMDVSSFAPTVATMVGLGVGIDYALLLVTRYAEYRRAGHEPVDAAGRATATAGRAVVFAGITVLVSLLGLGLGGLNTFESFGIATAGTVLAVMAAAVTLVPALARITDARLMRRGDRLSPRPGSFIARWVSGVARRPVLWTVTAAILLVALAAPSVAMRIWPLDASVDPRGSYTRDAYDLITEEFGPGANGPFLFVAEQDDVTATEAADLRESVGAHPDVLAVSPVEESPDGALWLWSAESRFAPQDERTPGLVEELREGQPDGVIVTGYAPMQVDLSDVVTERMWVVAGVVIALSLLLLTVMFRSVLVPVKAALMNLLSIGAAYGVIVAVFQTETGSALVGLDHPMAVSSFVPIIMFAILFGLSMDYEVFLLSRVREDWVRTGDAAASVVTGLASTGRVISSAAAIMVAVFVGFAFEPTPMIKMLGLGMAVAIALDATIVRLILVPATMTLLGRANWWIPGWLDRVLPRLEHGGPQVQPVLEAREPVGASR